MFKENDNYRESALICFTLQEVSHIEKRCHKVECGAECVLCFLDYPNSSPTKHVTFVSVSVCLFVLSENFVCALDDQWTIPV